MHAGPSEIIRDLKNVKQKLQEWRAASYQFRSEDVFFCRVSPCSNGLLSVQTSCALCVSVVGVLELGNLTTETQRTPRLHRELNLVDCPSLPLRVLYLVDPILLRAAVSSLIQKPPLARAYHHIELHSLHS